MDAPITQDLLREDGALRPSARISGEQSVFSATPRVATPQRAAQISAVLADVSAGPLSDRSRFEADVGTVHLHLRADGLAGERPVAFRWTHEATGEAIVVPGTLLPAETLRHVATQTIAPHLTGAWTVEVLSEVPGPDGLAPVLWRRHFEIAEPVVDPLDPALPTKDSL